MSETLKTLAGAWLLQAKYWQERIEAQLDFADRLAPDHTAVAAARALLAQAYRDGENLEQVGPRVEATLSPLAAKAKALTVHFIGHAHIDMNWQWSWPETVAVSLDTFATMLRLMEEYPAFTFSQSQASIYAIVERHHPDMLRQIAGRVREGRWEVTASHWVEGDKNLANGESLVRHLLLTRAYMKTLFGLEPEDVPVDWSPDTFGHAATVPNYLRAGGVKYCFLHRPGVYSQKVDAFRWRGTDGSEVLVYNGMRSGYCGSVTSGVAGACLAFAAETGCTHYPFVYGTGDHGGGPTRRDLERVEDMQRWPVFPTMRFSTTRGFFDLLAAVAPRLPVISGELNTEFAGCYTSQSLVKRVNRIMENRLADAEFAAALAGATAQRPHPDAMLEACWREALFTHFHDILPGSGVHDTRTYTHGVYQRVMADLGTEETLALRAVAARIGTAEVAVRPPAGLLPATHRYSSLGHGAGVWTGDGNLSSAELQHDGGDRPFVLFNSLAVERCEVVELTIWDDAPPHQPRAQNGLSFDVLDAAGRVVRAQPTGHGATWGHPYVKIAFPARVPALGYALYVVREAETPPAAAAAEVRFLGDVHHCVYSRIEREQHGMENEHLRLVLDPQTGGLRSLVMRSSGRECLDGARPVPFLRYGVERPGPMSSWLIDHTGGWTGGAVRAIRRGRQGPHRCSLEVDLRIDESDFTVVYTLDAGAREVRIDISGTWFQRGTPETGTPVLRLELPLQLTGAQARYEIPFGGLTRASERGEEQPALQWVAVANPAGNGLLLTNDCKYGFGLEGATLHATLIRGSYDPDPLPEIGRHTMAFGLRPFEGGLADADATAAARALNHPLRSIGTGIQEGALPLSASALTVTGAVLSSFRQRDDGVVVRLVETRGRETEATVRVNDAILGAFRSAVRTDLLERPEADLPWAGGETRVTLPANAIVTVRLRR